MSLRPTLDEFRSLAAQGNLVPVSLAIMADLETPVSVFQKLRDSKHAFLLESVEKGHALYRYSFLGADPVLVFSSKRGQQSFEPADFPGAEAHARPLDTLRALLGRYTPVADHELPPFTGGAVGFLAYDAVRDFENIPDANPDHLDTPEVFFFLADTLVAFDHVKHRMILIVNAHVEDDVDAAYLAAVEKLEALRERVTRPVAAQYPTHDVAGTSLEPTSNMTKQEFEDAVRAAKEYIMAGDAFQIVLSQRFQVPVAGDPFNIYRALRAVNPSPYMFYLQCGDFQLAGSSPEVLVKCQDGTVSVRPIAGTRPRGATPEEDRAYEKDLLSDRKEIAEHVMLVDLGRNDVGRVSTFGSVRVTEQMVIESYSHVMHIVSNVEGTLAPGRDAFDVMAACFPAGTLSGAPKIRAMQIIDELENTRRGTYGGSVAYFSYNGNMDSCITIRTALIKDGVASVQAGAGIVADSVPESEYEETRNKARAILRAIEWAERGLD